LWRKSHAPAQGRSDFGDLRFPPSSSPLPLPNSRHSEDARRSVPPGTSANCANTCKGSPCRPGTMCLSMVEPPRQERDRPEVHRLGAISLTTTTLRTTRTSPTGGSQLKGNPAETFVVLRAPSPGAEVRFTKLRESVLRGRNNPADVRRFEANASSRSLSELHKSEDFPFSALIACADHHDFKGVLQHHWISSDRLACRSPVGRLQHACFACTNTCFPGVSARVGGLQHCSSSCAANTPDKTAATSSTRLVITSVVCGPHPDCHSAPTLCRRARAPYSFSLYNVFRLMRAVRLTRPCCFRLPPRRRISTSLHRHQLFGVLWPDRNLICRQIARALSSSRLSKFSRKHRA